MVADWRHWTSEELASLDRVSNFHQLADVAIGVLSRMRSCTKEPIVQICGPMTTGGLGRLDWNMAFFEHALKVALKRGLVVFNQIPCQRAIGRIVKLYPVRAYCQEILDIFYRKVFESGHVGRTLFLPAWRSSHGASWERDLMTSLTIVAEDYPLKWLIEDRFVLPTAMA